MQVGFDFNILECPYCHGALQKIGKTLFCDQRHAFDIARSGYINLQPARSRTSLVPGDNKKQLLRRASFLAKGFFDFVSRRMVETFLRVRPDASAIQVLDAGCGTGYHLERVVMGLSEGDVRCGGLGLDVSKGAVQIALQSPSVDGCIISNIWERWPIRSAAVDCLINVFAPKNFGEMARVLSADGLLCIAYPGEEHLAELRPIVPLMGIRKQKRSEYLIEAKRVFEDVWLEEGCDVINLSRCDMSDLVLMGPNAIQLASENSLDPLPECMDVTIQIEILFARGAKLARP